MKTGLGSKGVNADAIRTKTVPRTVFEDERYMMGWIVATAGLLLVGFLIRRSVDKETTKSLKFLMKVLAAGFALLLLGAIVSTM